MGKECCESVEKHSIYDFEVNNIKGKKISLREYEGKVLLIVNTASKCGFTPQYKGLQELYEKFSSRGVEILAFPCNQFGSQEPEGEAKIQEFCDLNYHLTFPLFAKIDVNGDHADPLFEFLKESLPGLMGTKAIKWNFTKFLVDQNGKPFQRYSPQTTPAEIQEDIEKLLKS